MTLEELKLILKEGESLIVEFKEKYTSKINRDMVAFANTKGGKIFFGVNDEGSVVGQKLTNKLKAEINDLARNCDPCITIKNIFQVDKVVIVEIEEGIEKPYSCSDGYFRRLDAVTQKMNRKEIELFFKQSFKVSYEDQNHPKVTWNDISEDKIHIFFKESGINVPKIDSQKVLSSLNLSDGKNIKNAGVLFFTKSPRRHILHCEMMLVAFKGKNRIHVYDRLNVQDDL